MDPFIAALDENPEDWNLRLVYADWLDDHGDHQFASAQRWMANHQKRAWKPVLTKNTWTWGRVIRTVMGSTLDSDLLDSVPGDRLNSHIVQYGSRQNAERALAVALALTARI